jgi:hypothetical protein
MFDFLVGGKRLVVTGNRIESELVRETCPSCGGKSCCFDCDGSQGGEFPNSADEVSGRLRYNGMLDALESIVLAQACAGVKVDDPQYIVGLETALDAFGNND